MKTTTLSLFAQSVRLAAARGVAVSEASFPAGLNLKEHRHSNGYISLTLAGSVVDTIGGRDLPALAGFICYVPGDAPHANAFGSSGARCLNFEIEPQAREWLTATGVEMSRPWTGFGGTRAWAAFRLYRQLRNGSATALDVEGFVLSVLDRHSQTLRKSSTAPAWLGRVRDRLEAGLRRPPSLAALAQEAGVHPMHLVRAFRAQQGCSPGEYVQIRRVARACRLLLESDVLLSPLALQLGFHDQSHFTRVFKARLGVPPGAYRGRVAGLTPVRRPEQGSRSW